MLKFYSQQYDPFGGSVTLNEIPMYRFLIELACRYMDGYIHDRPLVLDTSINWLWIQKWPEIAFKIEWSLDDEESSQIWYKENGGDV